MSASEPERVETELALVASQLLRRHRRGVNVTGGPKPQDWDVPRDIG